MIPMIARDPFRRGLVLALAAGLGLATPRQTPAAQVASYPKLGATDLNRLIVLDQSGNRVAMPTRPNTGAVTLADGSVPSYVAYPIARDNSVPKGFPTVYTGGEKAGPVTGPLRLDAIV